MSCFIARAAGFYDHCKLAYLAVFSLILIMSLLFLFAFTLALSLKEGYGDNLSTGGCLTAFNLLNMLFTLSEDSG